ncbi:MAG: 50S ribosomal protein L4 [Clostridiales bacterium]
MPKVDLFDMDGKKIGDIDLNDNIFGIEVKKEVLHSVVVNQLANKRQGTQSTKTKSEVRGGGSKPWRQKGTGRARHGSIRSAQWIKGGVVFAPKPRSYNYTLPKKVKRLALKSALSSKVLEKDIIVLDDISFDEIKTKNMYKVLKNLETEKNALVILPTVNKSKDDESKLKKSFVIRRSSNNIPGVKTLMVNTINVYDILKYNKLILTKESLSNIEEVYA